MYERSHPLLLPLDRAEARQGRVAPASVPAGARSAPQREVARHARHPVLPRAVGCAMGDGRIATTVTVLALALGVFAMNSSIALELDRLGVFDENDVLFQTDPPCRLSSLAHGWCDLGRGYVHPNLANFSSLPIRALARLALALGVGGSEAIALRRQLAVFYAPFVSSLQFVILFVIFRCLDFSRREAILVSIFAATTFCQLIYGSIPESYAFSSFAIALAYLVAVDAMRHERTYSWALALGVGVFAAGITITNVVPLAILCWLTLRRLGLSTGQATRRSAIFTVAVVAVTFASAFVLDYAYRAPAMPIERLRAFATQYRRDDPLQRLADFPTALTNTVVSTAPRLVPMAIEPRTHRLGFTFLGTMGIFRRERIAGTLVFTFLVLGIARGLAWSGQRRAIAIGSILIIAYNGILHSFWGSELFLYASHWLIPLVVLMAGFLKLHPRAEGLCGAAFASLCVGVGVVNAQNLAAMFAVLRLQAAAQ